MNTSQYRILIIEDNTIAAKLVEMQLSLLGYITHVAFNGQMALEKLDSNSYDLILCDAHMPIMDGFSFIEIIKSNPNFNAIPIIIMSSDTSEDTIVRLLNAGADDFVAKPFVEKVFISKIQKVLAKIQKTEISVQKQIEQHLSLSQSTLIYCVNDVVNCKFDVSVLHDISFLVIQSETELFNLSIPLDDVCFLIDSVYGWAVESIHDLCENRKVFVSPILLIANELSETVFDSKYSMFLISPESTQSIILSQIKFTLQILQSRKAHSISLIKQAVAKSSFVFDKEFLVSTEYFQISVSHENYNDMPGGDFYEVFTFSKRYSLIFLGDIMGKSWAAWYYLPTYIAYIRSTIKFLISRNIKELVGEPEKIMNLLNSFYSKDLQLSQVFSTLLLAVVDNKKNRVILSSAGGLRPILYKSSQKKAYPISIDGMLMGIDSHSEYTNVEFEMNEGDKVLLYTDGFTDVSQLHSNISVGEQGVLNAFQECAIKKQSLATEFEQELESENTLQKFNDDRTAVIISCHKNHIGA